MERRMNIWGLFFWIRGTELFPKLQTALEFPHPPVYGAGNENSDSKRKDKQNLPGFLPSLIIICMSLPAFHLICLGLGCAVNMKSKQRFTSRDRAVVLECCYIYLSIIYLLCFVDFSSSLARFYTSHLSLSLPWVFCLFHVLNFPYLHNNLISLVLTTLTSSMPPTAPCQPRCKVREVPSSKGSPCHRPGSAST